MTPILGKETLPGRGPHKFVTGNGQIAFQKIEFGEDPKTNEHSTIALNHGLGTPIGNGKVFPLVEVDDAGRVRYDQDADTLTFLEDTMS